MFSLLSSSEIYKGKDVAAVPEAEFQEAGGTSRIIPVVPGRQRVLAEIRRAEAGNVRRRSPGLAYGAAKVGRSAPASARSPAEPTEGVPCPDAIPCVVRSSDLPCHPLFFSPHQEVRTRRCMEN